MVSTKAISELHAADCLIQQFSAWISHQRPRFWVGKRRTPRLLVMEMRCQGDRVVGAQGICHVHGVTKRVEEVGVPHVSYWYLWQGVQYSIEYLISLGHHCQHIGFWCNGGCIVMEYLWSWQQCGGDMHVLMDLWHSSGLFIPRLLCSYDLHEIQHMVSNY